MMSSRKISKVTEPHKKDAYMNQQINNGDNIDKEENIDSEDNIDTKLKINDYRSNGVQV
jgi:hypothetical protein